MDPNQRSEVNNQTNNGSNEKWNPGAKGNTRDLADEQRTPSGTGMAQADRPSSSQGQVASVGGQQGTTDSHQQQMEMHSSAWGELQQPVGNQQRDMGVSIGDDIANRQGETRTEDNPYPPSAQPAPHSGMLARDRGAVPGTVDGDARGTEAGVPGVQYGDIYGNRQSAGESHDGQRKENRADTQDASSSKIQQSTDRYGSQTGESRRDPAVDNIHQSNDAAGGLPRSPGSTGPGTEGEGYQPGGSMQAEPNPVHESNDAAGGYPRSPGGANKLAGDRKMDDDTGFSRG